MNVRNPKRQHIRQGRASVSWGPRVYGSPTIIASAPLSAIDDLVAAVEAAQRQLSDAGQ